jgi:hypothetical protein
MYLYTLLNVEIYKEKKVHFISTLFNMERVKNYNRRDNDNVKYDFRHRLSPLKRKECVPDNQGSNSGLLEQGL